MNRELNYGIDDSRLLVKGSLEMMDDIKTYYESQQNEITAKTGFNWGLISSSYGETLTISLTSKYEEKTEVTVVGEKNVEMNIGANPDRHVLEFINHLETLADYPLEDVIGLLEEKTANAAKEVTSPSNQADGSRMLTVIFVFLFSIFIFSLMI